MAENYGVKLTIDTSQVNRGVSEYESAISKIVSATEKALPRLSFERVFNQISLGSPVIQRVAESIANLSASISNVNRSMEGLSGKFTRVATAVEKIAENAPFAGRGLERLSESIAKTDFTKIDGIAKEYAKAIRTISKETEKVLEKISFDPLKQSLESAQQTLVPLGGTVRDFAKAFTELRTAISGSGQSFDSIVKSFGKIASGSDGFIKAVTEIATAVNNLPTTRVEAVTQSFQNLTAWARAAQQAIRDTGAALKASELSGASLPKTPKAPTISKNLLDYEKVDKARKAIEDFGKSLIKSVIVSNEFVKNLEAISKGLVKAGTSFSYASREIGIYVIRARQAASLKSVVPTTSSASIRKVATETRAAAESTRRSTQTIGQAFDNMGLRITAAVAVGNASVQAFKALIQGVVFASRDIINAVGFWERLTLSTQFYAAQARQAEGDTRQFEEVLNSVAGEAQVTIDWLQRLAVLSPFTAQQVATVYRVAQAYGLTQKAAQDLLPKLLDVAAAGGLDADVLQRVALALGQVEARGKLTGEEIRQLGNAGIPIRRLLVDALGIANSEFEDLVEQGFFTADFVIPLITKSLEQFDGAAERVSTETISGLINALTEIRQISEAKLFGGLFSQIQPQLQRLVEAFSDARVPALLQAIGEKIGEGFAYIADAAARYIRQALDWWNSLSEETRDSIVIFVAATAAIVTLGLSISALTAIITSLITPLTIAATALAGLFTWFTKGSTVLSQAQRDYIDSIQIIGTSTKAITTTINTWATGVSKSSKTVSKSLTDTATSTSSSASKITSSLSQSEQDFVGFSSSTSSSLQAVSTSISTLPEAVTPVSTAVSSATEQFIALGASASEPVEAISTGMTAVTTSTKQAATGVTSATKAIAGGFTGVSKAVNDATQNITKGTSGATKVVSRAATIIGDTFGGIARAASRYGADTMRVYAQGLSSGVNAVSSVISGVSRLISGLIRPQSPPAFLPELDKWGRDTMQVYLDSFSEADFGVINDVTGILRDLLNKGVSADGNETNIIRRVIGTREQVTKAIGEIVQFGRVTDETLEQVRSAAGSAGDEITAYLQSYARLSNATRQQVQLQEQLNNVQTKYERILRGLNLQLTKINNTQQQASDQQELIELQRVVNTAGISDARRQEAQANIQRILIEQQIRATEEKQATEEDALQTQLTVAEQARQSAENELNLLKERLGFQSEGYRLQLEYNQAIESMRQGFSDSSDFAGEMNDELQDALRAIQLQNEELNDNKRLFEAQRVLQDENATAAEKFAAQLVVAEVSLNRQIRDAEAAELGITLQAVRDILITIQDIQTATAGGLFGEESGIGTGGPDDPVTGLGTSLQELQEALDDAREKVAEFVATVKTKLIELNDALPEWLQFWTEDGQFVADNLIKVAGGILGANAAISTLNKTLGILSGFQALLELLIGRRVGGGQGRGGGAGTGAGIGGLIGLLLRGGAKLLTPGGILGTALVGSIVGGVGWAWNEANKELGDSATFEEQSDLTAQILGEAVYGGATKAFDLPGNSSGLVTGTIAGELGYKFSRWVRTQLSEGLSKDATLPYYISGAVANVIIAASKLPLPENVSTNLKKYGEDVISNINQEIEDSKKKVFIPIEIGFGGELPPSGAPEIPIYGEQLSEARQPKQDFSIYGPQVKAQLKTATEQLAFDARQSFFGYITNPIAPAQGEDSQYSIYGPTYSDNVKTATEQLAFDARQSFFGYITNPLSAAQGENSQYSIYGPTYADNVKTATEQLAFDARQSFFGYITNPIAPAQGEDSQYSIYGPTYQEKVDSASYTLGFGAIKSFFDGLYGAQIEQDYSIYGPTYGQKVNSDSNTLGYDAALSWESGFTSFWDNVDFVEQTVPRIFGSTEEIKTKIQNEVGNPAAEGIQAGINDYQYNGAPWWQKVLDAAKSAFGIQSPSTLARDQIGKPIGEGIGKGIEETDTNPFVTVIKDAIVKAFTDTTTEGKTKFETFRTDIETIMSTMAANLLLTIRTFNLNAAISYGLSFAGIALAANAFALAMTTIFANLKTTLTNEQTTLWTEVNQTFTGFVSTMTGTQDSLVPQFVSAVLTLFEIMQTSIEDRMEELQDDVKNAFSNLIKDLRDKYSQQNTGNPAYALGVDMVRAIRRGIESQADPLANTFRGVVKGAMDAANPNSDAPPTSTPLVQPRSGRYSVPLTQTLLNLPNAVSAIASSLSTNMFSSMPSQIASSGIVTNNYIRNYNLTVTSARSTESIALDFNRMEMVSY